MLVRARHLQNLHALSKSQARSEEAPALLPADPTDLRLNRLPLEAIALSIKTLHRHIMDIEFHAERCGYNMDQNLFIDMRRWASIVCEIRSFCGPHSFGPICPSVHQGWVHAVCTLSVSDFRIQVLRIVLAPTC